MCLFLYPIPVHRWYRKQLQHRFLPWRTYSLKLNIEDITKGWNKKRRGDRQSENAYLVE